VLVTGYSGNLESGNDQADMAMGQWSAVTVTTASGSTFEMIGVV
jgi:hypothetical protein